MSDGTHKDSADTKQRLLETAAKLFAEKGFDGTTVRMITDAANANPASINYHFRSKEELFREVARSRILAMREIMRQAATIEGDFGARLRHLVGNVLEVLWRDHGWFRAVADGMLHGGRHLPQVAREEVPRNVEIVRALLEEAMAAGEIRRCDSGLAAMSIMGPLFHVCTLGRAIGPAIGVNLEGRAARDAFVDHHVGLILKGLCPTDEGAR